MSWPLAELGTQAVARKIAVKSGNRPMGASESLRDFGFFNESFVEKSQRGPRKPFLAGDDQG
jgi:hypothetical protein